MKYTAALIATLSLISVASAGFTWSTKGCADVSSIAYSASMLTLRDHNLIYADSWAMKTLAFAKKIVKSIPSIDCTNLGQFPYDSSTYTNMFVAKQSSLYTRMLYFDTLTGTEAQYMCVDYTRLKWILTDNAADIPIPSWVT